MGLNKTKRNFCEGERQKAEDLQGKSGGLDTQIGMGWFPKEGLAGERRKQRLHVVRGPHFLWPASSLQPNPWLWLTLPHPPGLDGGCARLRPQTRLCSGLSPSWISSVLHICTDRCLLLMAMRDLIQRSRNIHLMAPHFGSKVKSQTVDFFSFSQTWSSHISPCLSDPTPRPSSSSCQVPWCHLWPCSSSLCRHPTASRNFRGPSVAASGGTTAAFDVD